MNFIIAILFNTKWPNLRNNVNPLWIKYRMEIFEKYTLQSLLNQTDNNLTIWMICCKESKSLIKHKYEFPKTKFIFGEEELKDKIEKYSAPTVVLKIDSDDCFSKDVIKETRTWFYGADGLSLLMFNNGYIYNIKTKQLNKFRRYSMPTYATIFPTRDDWTLENFKKYCWCDLTKVRDRFKPDININKRILLLDHDYNLSKDERRNNIFEKTKRTGFGNEVKDLSILKQFGVG